MSRSAKDEKVDTGIYRLLDCVTERIHILKSIERELTEAGAVAGTLHFKTGTNKMFHLTPSRDGFRKNTYIGVDPAKQADWTARIERFRILEQVIDARRKAEADNNRLSIELMHLTSRTVDACMISLKAIDKARASGLLSKPGKEQLKFPYPDPEGEQKNKIAQGRR